MDRNVTRFLLKFQKNYKSNTIHFYIKHTTKKLQNEKAIRTYLPKLERRETYRQVDKPEVIFIL